MRTKISALAAALLLTSAVAVDAKNPETRGLTRIRVIHNYAGDAVPPPPAVDARFGRNTDPAANPDKVKGARFGDITRYLRLKRPVTAGMFLAGTTTELFSANLGGPRGQRLTLLAEQQSSTSGAFFVQVLDDTDRKAKNKKANVRVIHGIPSAAADDVRFGIVGVGCITPAMSYPDNAVREVNAGTYTLGVFPPSDPDCSGDPIAGLKQQVKLNGRSVKTAIARVTPGDPSAFQLEVVRDF